MSEDLRIIKKLYGEGMMHFCRDYFSTILEEKGKLLEILQNNFAPSHALYDDLIKQRKITDFKDFIYNIFHYSKEQKLVLDVRTPQELLKQAGYVLYECKTEEDIQTFKKYYAYNEELCTFNGGRLNSCYVFFAVKENVDEIKRGDFSKPERQDLYGTSVISIQFSRDKTHTLSIKNRYNHRVANPDATFGNNLDNIIEGLTESFEKYYGMKQEYKNGEFELPGYVRAIDGKWYKYNIEIANIYYCPDNIIVDLQFGIRRYEKEKFILMDYFVLDLANKEIKFYDARIMRDDSFLKVIDKIKKITVVKKGEGREITIINCRDEEFVITLNSDNKIIGLKNTNLKQIGDYFLFYNISLENLQLPALQRVGRDFLYSNQALTLLDLPALQQAGSCFLFRNQLLKTLDLPSLKVVGANFLYDNQLILRVNLPNLQQVGSHFLSQNVTLEILELPELQQIGDWFFDDNPVLKEIRLPKLEQVGDYFLRQNQMLKGLELPLLKRVGEYFLGDNKLMSTLNLPSLEEAEANFLCHNKAITSISLPLLRKIEGGFLYWNESLAFLDLPMLEESSHDILIQRPELRDRILDKLKQIEEQKRRK